MTDFKQIYSHQADRYEALVAREDYAQNLPRAGANLSVATVADNRQLPVSDGVADVSIAGWSFGHFTGWYPSTWRVEIEQAIEQLRRVLRPDGVMIIIETLGTGSESPQAPSDALAAYYRLLEQDYGFSSTWIRMDFRFESSAEAAALLGFFFGDALADHVARTGLTVLSECTGLWRRRK